MFPLSYWALAASQSCTGHPQTKPQRHSNWRHPLRTPLTVHPAHLQRRCFSSGGCKSVGRLNLRIAYSSHILSFRFDPFTAAELTLLKDIEPLPRWPSARSKTAKQSLANHENSSLAEPFRVVSSPSSPSCSVSSDSSRAILDAGISEHPPGTSVHRSSTGDALRGGRPFITAMFPSFWSFAPLSVGSAASSGVGSMMQMRARGN